MNKHKLVISSAYAAILTIIFVVIITIWTEFSAPLKEFLTNFSGHHWTSKSIFSVALYVVATLGVYFVPCKYHAESIKKALKFLFVMMVLGIISIALFYTGHYFKIF